MNIESICVESYCRHDPGHENACRQSFVVGLGENIFGLDFSPMLIDIDTLLAWGAAYKKLSPGEVVFREGGICSFYYQLVSGSVKWVNVDDGGTEFIQNIIEPGECFGEIPLFGGGTFVSTAIAENETVILRLHRSSFDELIKERPDILLAITKLMARRLRYKFLLAKELAYNNPEHSISFLLSYLKETHNNVCDKCNKVNLTRQQIAGMTGLRVETVIRAIRSLHLKGLLLIDKGKVYC